MLRVIMAATVTIAAASAASAQQAAAPAQAAQVKEKKICRAEASTGSIMVKRTCRTKAEWDALAQANRGTFADMRDQQERTQTSAAGRVTN